jgi:alkanesulfonate monooxygenase SsuD/methylene tetrahydromethanopterin reductase-like flavin-dependent oxidoreductase (luciferase family)
MRYENPLYMAEEAAATDLISDGRLELGVSRGSPETALRGSETFGFVPPEGMTDADLARQKVRILRDALAGAPVAQSDPAMTRQSLPLSIEPRSPGLEDRIWWGAGSFATARWAAEQGMNLQSSTLLLEEEGVPFDELQARQIREYRAAWSEAGWERTPRVSVSRSVLPITSDLDRMYFGGRGEQDQVATLEGVRARFGRSYTGEPDAVAAELAADAAVQEADTLLLTVPNQLGVEYNARLLRTVVESIAPALGWSPATAGV